MSYWYNQDKDYPTIRGVATIFLIMVVVITGVLGVLGLKKVPVGEVGLSYGGGPIEANHFQGIHDGGSPLFENGVWDRLYEYPTTQRTYIISKTVGEGDFAKGATADFVSAPTNDKIPVQWEVAVYFKLNTNAEVLRRFHEKIGIKYRAWTPDGWDQMLQEQFRPQIQLALQEETRRYQVTAIYSTTATLTQIQHDVGVQLKDNIDSVLGGQYFCGVDFVPGRAECNDFTFVIKNVTIPANVVQAFENNRTSQIQVDTETNKVLQAQQQAKAVQTLNAALSRSNSYNYILLQAIESGKITFWVLPGGSGHGGITIQGPHP